MKKLALYSFPSLLFLASCSGKTEAPATAPPATEPIAAMVVPQATDTVLPSGRHNYYLVGNRNKEGFFLERSFFPAGYKGTPHVHSAVMYVTIIKGNWHLGYGDAIDTTKGEVYGPGSFVMIPPDKVHYEWFTEDCLMQLEGFGPYNTFYADKEDSVGKK